MIDTKYLFFTGKGGVGKTSLACATAINLAHSGKSVLLVSTDPASNLDDVLEIPIGQQPTKISEIDGLWAQNLDPEEAAREYREQLVGSYRGILPDSAISSMEEQLSGACTVEIAAFNLFSELVSHPSKTAKYDHVVFDTAPTGHTLRLLSLPKAWSGFLGENLHGTSCIGPLAGLQEQRQQYESTVANLTDATKTILILVTRPEASALVEAERASRELGELGLTKQLLLINGVLNSEGTDEIANNLIKQQSSALREMPAGIRQLPQVIIPLMPLTPVGSSGLHMLAEQLQDPGAVVAPSTNPKETPDNLSDQSLPPSMTVGLNHIVTDLGQAEKGLILVMGKGGVGKTTVAASVALSLLNQGHRVHLSTTDPAAHLSLALGNAGLNAEGRFSVSRIDPALEVETYRQEMMATLGSKLDAEGKELLLEDLSSPCTEEIAVFRAFARTVKKVEDGFVVLDTAPTGHTLLLLDNTQSYHRELERSSGETPEEVMQLLPRLRDPALTHVLVVTLAQATPVLEAGRLQEDLRRAKIEPGWWIINQTWTGVPTADPILQSLARSEIPWLEKVAGTLAKRAVRIPWFLTEPTGPEGLAQLF